MDFNAEDVDMNAALKAGPGITEDVKNAGMTSLVHPIHCFIN